MACAMPIYMHDSEAQGVGIWACRAHRTMPPESPQAQEKRRVGGQLHWGSSGQSRQGPTTHPDPMGEQMGRERGGGGNSWCCQLLAPPRRRV